MKIRQVTINDLDKLVALDRKSYGDYGANIEYLRKKIKPFPQGTLVIENNGEIIGFVVTEIFQSDEIPEDFCNMTINVPISGKWMHPVMFTTKSNYKDTKTDSKLLKEAERIAKKHECVESLVPLSIDHPYAKNGVFEFWLQNGYQKAGSIKWVTNDKKFIDCFVYRKKII